MNKLMIAMAGGVMGAMVLALPLGGCSTAPKTEEARSDLAASNREALAAFKDKDPSLNDVMANAVGYAIFPDVGKAGVGVGGAYGRGEVFERGAKVGYADITQATVGAQLGAQNYRELIVFKTQEALDKFKNNQFAFSANASAVAIKNGAAKAADFPNGAAVWVMTRGGLMAEASIGAQRFTYQPM